MLRLRVRASLIVFALTVTGGAGGIGSSGAQASTVFTDLSLPTITGSAVAGQTLSETHAAWSSPPTGYHYQWQRCNHAGTDCESIEEATSQTYRLTTADVGFTIRVGESARNAEGAVTPAISEPTAVVQAGGATGGKGGGGGGGPSGGGPPVSCCGKSTQASPAQIKALLARQIAPAGKTARISALLAHGGLRMSFTFPEAGALSVQWYLVPPGAKLARKTQAKPILVATGHATFIASATVKVAIRLTAQGEKLLRHATKLKLEAKGAFAPKGESALSTTKKFVLKR
jgi:hypothetical protein